MGLSGVLGGKSWEISRKSKGIQEEGTTELGLKGRWGLGWVMFPAKARNIRFRGTSSKELAIAGAQSSDFLPTGRSVRGGRPWIQRWLFIYSFCGFFPYPKVRGRWCPLVEVTGSHETVLLSGQENLKSASLP